MSAELSPERKEDAARTVAGKLTAGKNKYDIINGLIDEGWHPQSAIVFVNEVKKEIHQYADSPEVRQAIAGKYARHMIYGVPMVIGGIVLVVTDVPYIAAAIGYGTYATAWGVLLFGIIRFFGWRKFRRQAIASKYAHYMLYGVLIAIGGIVITGVPYVTASGAFLLGIAIFVEGLLGWRKYRVQ